MQETGGVIARVEGKLALKQCCKTLFQAVPMKLISYTLKYDITKSKLDELKLELKK